MGEQEHEQEQQQEDEREVADRRPSWMLEEWGSHRQNPLLEAMRPRMTGNILVVFEDGIDFGTRTETLRAAAETLGLDVRSGVSAAEAADPSTEGSRARLFANLSVAVVQPQEFAQANALQGALSELDGVAEVRPEYYLYALEAMMDTTQSTWGLDATKVIDCPYTGRGIRLAILDTGFDFDHPDFAGRIIVEKNFIKDSSIDDIAGHGTHCAGTAAGPRVRGMTAPGFGCAPDVELYIGKVLNDRGYASEGAVADGMQWAIDSGCHIVSMSLGRPVREGEPPTAYYDTIGTDALAAGCLMIAAAGNNSSRLSGGIAPVNEPANSLFVMSVAAVDENLEVAYFSAGGVNPRGGSVDIAAPGVGIFSAFPFPQNYAVLQGTSMACPHVAGIAALYAESDPTLRGQKLWDALIENAMPLSAPARDVGAGLVQAPKPPSGAGV